MFARRKLSRLPLLVSGRALVGPFRPSWRPAASIVPLAGEKNNFLDKQAETLIDVETICYIDIYAA